MTAEIVNKHLKRFGLNPYDEPLVRVAWSDDQRELRRGTFNEFYGNIFLRSVTGVRPCLKYSWIHERWVLERWYPPSLVHDSDLPDTSRGSYEPVYVFQNSKGEALPLNLRVAELICSAMLNYHPSRQQIKTEVEDMLNGEDTAMQSYFEDALDMSVLGTQLRLGEATAFGKHKGGS